MDEVLGWFERNGVQFLSSIPSIGDVEFDENEPVFASHSPGTRLDRLSTEIEMLLSGGTDGGLYHDWAESFVMSPAADFIEASERPSDLSWQ